MEAQKRVGEGGLGGEVRFKIAARVTLAAFLVLTPLFASEQRVSSTQRYSARRLPQSSRHFSWRTSCPASLLRSCFRTVPR